MQILIITVIVLYVIDVILYLLLRKLYKILKDIELDVTQYQHLQEIKKQQNQKPFNRAGIWKK